MAKVNAVGLEKNEYRGAPTTLCAGCGHNSISNQIIQAAYDLSLIPEDVIKFSGIGCSSKSPTYFLGRSFGFNSLHGRMPSVATGALFGDARLKAVAVSGDGDSTNIGIGQFKHILRRNAPMVYIIENNGVYGLTKGQFSATAEQGLTLKYQGANPYMPVDVIMEALVSQATFVARSFAGDATQVRELIKAALSHDGLAILDIISPCVTFNNADDARHSYGWAKEHQDPLHDFSFVPFEEEIEVEMVEGETRRVTMHDGSSIILKKLDEDYDPTNRKNAMDMIQQSYEEDVLMTGLIYINTEPDSLLDMHGLSQDEPLNRLGQEHLRPKKEAIDAVNAMMF
ncbi:MAG: 2-oxoacid:ferredoxin oxidoreductase subunit beta [Chloroflexi bacterium]|nr:MAG: 2-oxoacid:ferredoxin oxidoreductase subunit beta [Chloroflexota bacterium]MBL1194762.1 2-oxoacid:ferredoxin oxidoreductase subunit beta [Chloroflexota bacterium]NOH12054.1 2-oxoacid:ferredoxin oxidoreductase subunit beta [Chloroflexota bacterium]